MPKKEALLTEEEAAVLAQQMTFESVFDDLQQVQMEQSQLDARAERDEQVIIYKMSRTPDAVGSTQESVTASNGKSMTVYKLLHGGFELVAKPSVGSNRIDYTKVNEALDDRYKYYCAMSEKTQQLVDAAETPNSKAQYMADYERYVACANAVKEIIDVRTQVTKLGQLGNLTLSIEAIKVPKKTTTRKPRAKKDGN